MSGSRNFCQFYLVLSLFYSLKRGSNGFIAEKTILILYKGSRGGPLFSGGGGGGGGGVSNSLYVDTVHVRHMQRARVGGGGVVWTPLKIASSIACIWTVNIGHPSSPTGTLEH